MKIPGICTEKLCTQIRESLFSVDTPYAEWLFRCDMTGCVREEALHTRDIASDTESIQYSLCLPALCADDIHTLVHKRIECPSPAMKHFDTGLFQCYIIERIAEFRYLLTFAPEYAEYCAPYNNPVYDEINTLQFEQLLSTAYAVHSTQSALAKKDPGPVQEASDNAESALTALGINCIGYKDKITISLYVESHKSGLHTAPFLTFPADCIRYPDGFSLLLDSCTELFEKQWSPITVRTGKNLQSFYIQ